MSEADDKAFLIQIMKQGTLLTNIAVRDSQGKYKTDMGEISDQFETDMFDYRYMSFVEMRSLLRANINSIMALKIR